MIQTQKSTEGGVDFCKRKVAFLRTQLEALSEVCESGDGCRTMVVAQPHMVWHTPRTDDAREAGCTAAGYICVAAKDCTGCRVIDHWCCVKDRFVFFCE